MLLGGDGGGGVGGAPSAVPRIPLSTSERKCCIKGCDNISMFKQCHQFPATLERRETWIKSIGPHLDDELIGQPPERFKSRVVCTDHFAPTYLSGASSRFLKRTAVPTIFRNLAVLHPSHNVPQNVSSNINRGMVVAKQKPLQNTSKVFRINKRTAVAEDSKKAKDTEQPIRDGVVQPTLLVEPLKTNNALKKKKMASSNMPMCYISNVVGGLGRKNKPALKITKVYPNRKNGPRESVTDAKSINDQLEAVYIQESLYANFENDPEYFEFRRTDEPNVSQENILEDDNFSPESMIEVGESARVDSENVAEFNTMKRFIESFDANSANAPVFKQSTFTKTKRARCMESTPDLPECAQYLLLGGGAASVAAMRAIQRHDSAAKILIVTQEYAYPYERYMLSKEEWWSGGWGGDDKLCYNKEGEVKSLLYEPPSYYVDPAMFNSCAKGVSVARGCTVRKIDARRRSVVVSRPGLPDKTLLYDKCLIATGARPRNIPVLENAVEEVKDRCVQIHSTTDVKELADSLKESDRVVIIGGGLLASEIAAVVRHRVTSESGSVTLIFRETGVLSHILPDYLSGWCTRQLAKAGITIVRSTEVLNAYMKNNRVTLELSNAEIEETDLILVCVGSAPNTDFAAVSNLEVHPQLGGVVVNAEFCVQKHLYAAGDVACYFAGDRRRSQHVRHASESGRLAGEMMSSGTARELGHVEYSSRITENIRYEAIGVIDSNLEMVGAFPNLSQADGDKNYDAGVVFYLHKQDIVGVLLWNLVGRMHIARQLLNNEHKQKEDINDLADLFIVSNADERKKEAKEPQPGETSNQQSFQCEHCTEVYERRSEIIKHLSKDHTQHSTCQLCNKNFASVLKLKEHYYAHLSKRPLQSDDGDKKLSGVAKYTVFKSQKLSETAPVANVKGDVVVPKGKPIVVKKVSYIV